MKLIISNILLIILFVACADQSSIKVSNVKLSSGKIPVEQKKLLDSLQYKSFLYFIKECDINKGLVKDRSTPESPASIAAMGFAIPVWAVGVENGWITRKEAAGRTMNMLMFLKNAEQSTNKDATGYKGFYYHFLDFNTGKRTWQSELSTIDTAWLLAGIRFAYNYFSGDNVIEVQIRRLAELLTERVDWNWVTSGYHNEFEGSISLGWKPESGFDKIGWVGYNEALFLYIIAAGSDYGNARNAYSKWLSTYNWKEPFTGLAHVVFPPLFGHQYSHIFIDFKNLQDEYMKKKGIDYFENSKRAVFTQWKYAVLNPLGWKGYDSLTWGLTACDGPGPAFNFNGKNFYWYTARGTSGPGLIMNDDGTIAPTAAVSSIVFAPDLVIKTIFNLYSKYGEKGLWGKYGFVDSFNPTLNWYDSDYLAIDQAPMILMIQNYKNGFVWKYVMQDSYIRKGLNILGFERAKENN